MPRSDLSIVTELVLKLDQYIYARLCAFRGKLPGEDKSLSVFLLVVGVELAVYAADMFSDPMYNPRPLYVFPVLLCAVFSERNYTYAAACLACALNILGFAAALAPGSGSFPFILNATPLFLAYVALAEFASLAVGTIREFIDYIASLEEEVAALRLAAHSCADGEAGP